MNITDTLTRDKIVTCKVHCRQVNVDVSLDSLDEIFSTLTLPSILGGNSAKSDADGFSYWAYEPREIFELQMDSDEPFERLQAAIDKYGLEPRKNINLPKGIFCGGWVGYFSYELGRYIERISESAVDDIKIPLVRLCFYDKVICFDHKQKRFLLIALEFEEDSQSPDEKLDELEVLLRQAGKVKVPSIQEASMDDIRPDTVQCNMTKDYYLQTVEKIRRYIYDGVVYQVNFSQRFCCDYEAEPVSLFHWQNRYNPSGYSAYIAGDDFAVVSASPEMFVTIVDGRISTKPIKGTRRRVPETSEKNVDINKHNFRQLANSLKEQAELNMIIDLERNDMVRICEYGTRSVTQGRTIETYPTVFHAVATVGGRLRQGITICDVLKAMFPGGSITGAPKISAMNIIDETEPTCRGVYTGSIGYIGVDGSVCLNIAIRTVIIKGRKAYVQAGGGIVADSDPQAEWDETIVKARALLAGISMTNIR
jgi:anthranilate/para-aminobenzoate synthase component I